MVVHYGSRTEFTPTEPALYHIQSNTERYALHPVQVSLVSFELALAYIYVFTSRPPPPQKKVKTPDMKYLNSRDAFVLIADQTQYIWFGAGCDDLLHERAAYLADVIFSDVTEQPSAEEGEKEKVVTMEEGKETSGWTAIVGTSKYPSSAHLR